jgi:hypothetical protein
MKNTLIRFARRWHHILLWPAFFALFLFVLSGFTHILMSWTGPQAAQAMPPRTQFSAAHISQIPVVLQRHSIHQAAIVKLIPSARGPVLQVTLDEKSPRRYFEIDRGDEIIDGDQAQALWLAQHYAGNTALAVTKIEFLTAFDASYAWVNRLLPVYRITLDDVAHTTLTVHTETGALAEINNDWKRSLQSIFQQLHTFKWLEDFAGARLVLMLLLLSSLLAMIIAGANLLYAIPARKIPKSSRRWHRRLAHFIWLPLFGFVASGIYHLLYSELATETRGLRLLAPLTLTQVSPLTNAALPAQALNAINVLQLQDQLLLRASLAPAVKAPASTAQQGTAATDEHAAHAQRNARFDGINHEQAALYFNAQTGAAADITDEQVAQTLAAQFMQTDLSRITHSEKITRFGPGYDFRNKRLPVWRVDFNNAEKGSLFIDVASGVLVDSANNSSRAESYSFSFLHKWNFLTPLTGREWRDGLMVFTLTLALLLAALGILLRRPR